MSAKRTLTSDLSDLSGIKGGLAGARVPGDEQSRRERAQQQRDAWAYLNHHYTPEQATELADILGLTPDSREPGHCACGTPLAISSLFTGTYGYKHDRCHSCSTGSRPAPRPVEAAKVAPPALATTHGTARCGACDRDYRLTSTGRLRPHPAWTVRDGVPLRRSWNCKGSGRFPREVE